MSDTKLADILDKLYDVLVAETTIATAIAANTLVVYDGPPINDLSRGTLIAVGGMPVIDGDLEVTSSWDWSSLGRSGTYADVAEWIDVPFGLATLTGDANMRTARRTLIGLYAAAAALFRGEWYVGQGIDTVMWSIPGQLSLTQRQTSDGAEIVGQFVVRIRTQT